LGYLLDTDTFSRALRGDERIRQKIREADSPVYLSIISAREALKGALATVAEAESPNSRFRGSVSDAYQFLEEILKYIDAFSLYPYQNAAEHSINHGPRASIVSARETVAWQQVLSSPNSSS
jgi:predicted nucleic acid-binding protein